MLKADDLVTVSAYGNAGSSARVRILEWLRILELSAEQHTYLNRASNPLSAILLDPAAVLAAELDLRRLADSVSGSTVLLSREASPLSFGSIEARLLRRSARGVYDFDDALYSGYPGGFLSRARHIHVVWRRAVEAADVVIAGSDTLASHAAKHSSNVVMIPSCVEPGDYVVKTSYAVGGVPRVVWLGSPSTERQLQLIGKTMLALNRAFGLRLTLISAGNRSLGELDAMIDRVEWTATGFSQVVASADLGIMPLYDDEWTRGKCAYKLLQYAAAGLPVVGSEVGANVQVLRQLGGIAASTADDWLEALSSLLQASETSRRDIGTRARAQVIEHFSYGAWARRWRNATGL